MATADSSRTRPADDDPDARRMLEVRRDLPGAFEALVDAYQGRLLRILAHLVGRSDEAEDLTQEVFLRVYRARGTYEPTARFSTWLFTIAHRVATNHLRGQGRRPKPWNPAIGSGEGSGPVRLEEIVPSRQGTASTQFRRAELSEVVRQALDGLGEDQKLAVLLNKFEAMSYAEIADVMGRSEAAVKSLLARARTTLRDRLTPYLDDGRRP